MENQSILEFMQEYFAERDEFLREWKKHGYSYRQSVYTPKQLASIEESIAKDEEFALLYPPTVIAHTIDTDSSVVVTREADLGKLKRCRYSVISSEHGWRIDDISVEDWSQVERRA